MCAWAGDAFSSTDRTQGRQRNAAACTQGRALRKALSEHVFSVFSTGFGLLYICNNNLQDFIQKKLKNHPSRSADEIHCRA
jgi:hypothetical protein